MEYFDSDGQYCDRHLLLSMSISSEAMLRGNHAWRGRNNKHMELNDKFWNPVILEHFSKRHRNKF